MSFTPLASDFYDFSSKLTAQEQGALTGLRAWLEADVKPVVNDFWDRAEFPHELLPAFHAQPVFGMQWEERSEERRVGKEWRDGGGVWDAAGVGRVEC